MDDDGNFYFGSHSGNFYSLSASGDIRWVFSTRTKIYGSPVLADGQVIFAGGDGFLYALSLPHGSIEWVCDLKKGYSGSRSQKLVQAAMHLPFTWNRKRLMNMDTKCWASVNHAAGQLFITAFGKGLHVFDTAGNELWSYDLGFPRYQLAGVVLDETNDLYLPSRNGRIYRFTPGGKQVWKRKVLPGWHAWGSPTYNPDSGLIQFVFSIGESKGVVLAVDKTGQEQWRTKLKGAIHGSVAVSADSQALYCADFAGYIHMLEAQSGRIIRQVRLSRALRALWTTPTVDAEGSVYISTKDSFADGRVVKLDRNLEVLWEYPTAKALSVPLLLANGDICFGAWDGYYYRLSTDRST